MNIGAQRFATKARTWLLIAGLTALLIGIGALIGGVWLYVFVVLAVAMNVGAYWFSDRLALGVSRASQVEPGTRPNLEAMVRDLARRAELPVPRLYTIRSEQPNAFATGRNPEHAAVAVTEGLLQRLPLDQVKSVLAHEFGHIKNRDTLVSSIVAMVAGAIAAIANLFQFSLLFGGDEDDGRPLGWIGLIGTVIFAPLAASLLQLAVSRQREYLADATGAELLGRASPLADALEALERGAQALPRDVNPATASLYIVNPLRRQGTATLFSTHPPIAERARSGRLTPTRPPRRAAKRGCERLSPTDEGGEMPPIISRGFRGRRDDAPNNRVPPGQYVTRDFPILSAGPTPHTPLDRWDFSIIGEVDEPRRWTWEEFRALPSETVTVDIHCVTKWSKLDTVWHGVSVDTLLDGIETAAEHVLQFSDGGYTTNLPLEDVTGGKAWVAFAYDSGPLEPEHGGPARMLVPHLYFWKSAKWVRGLRLMATDDPGFWEVNGYHNYGDPWQEQRYWGD